MATSRRILISAVLGLAVALLWHTFCQQIPLLTFDRRLSPAKGDLGTVCAGQPVPFWSTVAEKGLQVPITPSSADGGRYYALIREDDGENHLVTLVSTAGLREDEAAEALRSLVKEVPFSAPIGEWPNQTNRDQWARIGAATRVQCGAQPELVSTLEAYRLRDEWETDPRHKYILYRIGVFSPRPERATLPLIIEVQLDSDVLDYGSASPEHPLTSDDSDLSRKIVSTRHIVSPREGWTGEWILVSYPEAQESAHVELSLSGRSNSTGVIDSYGLNVDIR